MRFYFFILFMSASITSLAQESNDDLSSFSEALRGQEALIQDLRNTLAVQAKAIEELKVMQAKPVVEATAIPELKAQIETILKSLEEMKEQGKTETEALKKEDEQIKAGGRDLKQTLERLEQELNRLKEMTAKDFESVLFNGIEFVKLPAGTFVMGTEDARKEELVAKKLWSELYSCEQPARSVTISRAFFMAKTELTQTQWRQVMDRNPAAFQEENRPVESVSWNDVQEFIRRLNERSGGSYRLPTEAEWEYAARAGCEGEFGADGEGKAVAWEILGDYGWIASNAENRTHPVEQKKANRFGLHDMHGNVWEWCQDWFLCEAYRQLGAENPVYAQETTERVFRGGCWTLEANFARAAFRSGNLPTFKSPYVGFRLVREIQP